jgi:hypothetical protein
MQMMNNVKQEKFTQRPDRFTVYRGHHNRLLHGMSLRRKMSKKAKPRAELSHRWKFKILKPCLRLNY